MSQSTSSDQAEPPAHTTREKHALICQTLEDEDSYRELERGITIFVFKLTDIRDRGEVRAFAAEVLQEAVKQALAKVDTYDPRRPAPNWLLGFAINIIRQSQRDQHRTSAYMDKRALDQLKSLADRLHGHEAEELLSLVSTSDQQVLRLGVIEDESTRAIAERLGITEGAARVRFHRAIQRLRRAFTELS